MTARHAPSRRTVFAVIMLALLPVAALAQAAGVSGVYRAEGRNPDGSAYAGRAVVAELDGAVQINWTVGEATYSGNGSRDGQVITITWGQDAPVVYVVMPDGNLHGTWDNGRALERLIRQ